MAAKKVIMQSESPAAITSEDNQEPQPSPLVRIASVDEGNGIVVLTSDIRRPIEVTVVVDGRECPAQVVDGLTHVHTGRPFGQSFSVQVVQ